MQKVQMVVPPYIAFGTLTGFVDHVVVDGLPARVDKDYLEGLYERSTAAQLSVTLRFVGFVDETTRQPTAELELVAAAEAEERPRTLWDVLIKAYQPALAYVDLSSVSRASLEDAFNVTYGITDATLRKCIRFFINAAQYCGITLSDELRSTSRRSAADRSLLATSNRPHLQPIPIGGSLLGGADSKPRSSEKTVQLASGGTVTVVVDAGWFDIPAGQDRDFILGLIDSLTKYERECKDVGGINGEEGNHGPISH